MTECSQPSFGFLGRREVVGRFDGGLVSSDGGLLLREIDRRYGVRAALAGCLRDRRQPGKVRQPTLSRFENGLSRTDLYQAGQVWVDLFVARTMPPARIILDVDATDDPTHSDQQLSFLHGYHDTYCCLALLAFPSADRGPQQLLGAVLRPGRVHAGAKTVVILQRLVAQLRVA
jgi:hypothetical protein